MIPNVLGIQSQFAPLVTIWSSCIEELRPVSRILAKGIEVTAARHSRPCPTSSRPGSNIPKRESGIAW